MGRYPIRSSDTPQFPDQIVMFGGHTDSWDVGQGAQDDGAGFMVSYEALYVSLNCEHVFGFNFNER